MLDGLAPPKNICSQFPHQKRPVSRLGKVFDLAFDFDLPAPSGGRAEVLRSGSPGMDAGRAAMGHGWPVAAGPRSGAGVREPERSEGRTPGAKALWLLCRFYKVTRCKSETNIPVRRKCRICTRSTSYNHRVHIHSMCHGCLRVPPLRRLTFVKQPQK